ncbi:MAG: hypothetical protein ACK4VL_02310, partial [Chitinophagales bacterium]
APLFREGLAGLSREKTGRVFSQDLTLTMWRWKNKFLTNITQYSIRLNPFTSKDFNRFVNVDIFLTMNLNLLTKKGSRFSF